MDTSTLSELDKDLLLTLNGSDSIFWDGCMKVYTSMAIWIPLIFMLVYVLVKNHNIRNFFMLLLFIGLVIGLSDTISSGICKPLFERWRPTRDPIIMHLVDVTDGIRGGFYGFTSSHAANSFGIATFLILLIKNRALTISLIIWASMNAFTRIYLGVHYPGDIIAGTITGVTVGWCMYKLYCFVQKRQKGNAQRDWISDQYTRSGYLVSDIYLLLVAMYATFVALPMISFFTFVY